MKHISIKKVISNLWFKLEAAWIRANEVETQIEQAKLELLYKDPMIYRWQVF